MMEVRYDDLTKLDERLAAALRKFPELRKKLVADVGELMHQDISRGFGGAKVAHWQDKDLGSGGGYAAVRPKAKTWEKGYAVGHITNAIESGHKTRGPSGKSKHYRPKPHLKVFVQGKRIYADEEKRVQAIARTRADQLIRELESMMEG